MKLTKIETSCRTIVSELKSGQFTESELIMVNTLFSKIVQVTDKMLLDKGVKDGIEKRRNQ